MRSLANYSEAELLEELARRCTLKEEKKQVAKWCHNCKHFKTWADNATGKGREMPEDYNPCGKQHRMYFRMPEDYDDEHGFYRTVCKDRDEGEAADGA